MSRQTPATHTWPSGQSSSGPGQRNWPSRGCTLHAALEKHPAVTGVSGLGLLFGFELDRPAKPVVRALVDQGVLCGGSSNPNQIRLLPPLTLTEDEALRLLPALDKALAAAGG